MNYQYTRARKRRASERCGAGRRGVHVHQRHKSAAEPRDRGVIGDDALDEKAASAPASVWCRYLVASCVNPTNPLGPCMKHALASLAALLALAGPALAQVPVTAAPDHTPLLASADPKLAANKRLVYDFWREVFEAGQLQLADKYLADSYIQHNPGVPTGRKGFVDFFSRLAKARPVEPRMGAPLVSIVAERDLVVLSFVREQADPKDPTQRYTTTWFDMFRIENGKIAEHWDPAGRP